MRNCSLTGLDLLEGPPWSLMLLEVLMVLVVHAAARGHYYARDSCGLKWSVLLTEYLVMSLGCAAWAPCACEHPV